MMKNRIKRAIRHLIFPIVRRIWMIRASKMDSPWGYPTLVQLKFRSHRIKSKYVSGMSMVDIIAERTEEVSVQSNRKLKKYLRRREMNPKDRVELLIRYEQFLETWETINMIREAESHPNFKKGMKS